MSSMSEFKDKIILITGAASGIGKAIAESLSDQGAIVIANYHSRIDEANILYKKLKGNNQRSSIERADVSNYEEVSALLQKIDTAFGRIDGLINCSGVVIFQNLEYTRITLKNKLVGRDWQKLCC